MRLHRSERRRLQRSTCVSLGMHALVLACLIFSLPMRPVPEPPPPPTVEVEFEDSSSASAHKADRPAEKPAPAPAPVRQEAPPAPTPPEMKQPVEEPLPPPPAPPPVPAPPEVKAPLVKSLTTPRQISPSPVSIPAPPRVSPPSASHAVAPPSPMTQPTEDTLPKVQTFSRLTQPREAKKTAANSHSLLSTLEKFRADQSQTHAPKARANPRQGGAPHGGGSPSGDITRALTVGQQRAIGNSVRRCYSEDTAARNYSKFVARLVVTVDASGEARMVEFAPSTRSRMAADPSYRAFAERARGAVLSPTCARLPLPAKFLGQTHRLSFVFRP